MSYKDMFNAQKDYVRGKIDANGDNVEFRLTYEDWLDIWIKSGQIDNRGIHKGQYCMSRYNDIGHYEVGNVFIQLHSDNVSQAQTGRKKTYDNSGENNPFFNKKHKEESKEKIRIARAKQVIDPKCAAHFKGKKQDPEHVRKRIENMLKTKAMRKQNG